MAFNFRSTISVLANHQVPKKTLQAQFQALTVVSPTATYFMLQTFDYLLTLVSIAKNMSICS
jgi:hypothetical protein